MEADREQSWRIHVTSKAKNFNFRFRFTATTLNNNNPIWTLSLCNLSIVLKLRKFVFRIHSHPTQPQPIVQPKNIRTKVMKFVHKFRARVSKNRSNIAPAKRESNLPYPKDPIHIGFWIMGFLSFIAQCISKIDQKGIMMLASVGCFAASLLFKKFKTTKLMNLAAFLLVVATIVCYMLFYFDNNYWDYMARSAWNKIEKDMDMVPLKNKGFNIIYPIRMCHLN